MRVTAEILLGIVVLGVLMAAATGMRTAFPAFYGAIRVLLHPGVLLGLVVIVILLRLGYPRRSGG